MATASGPLATDQPLELTREGNQPAITIYDNSGSSAPPIQIIRRGQPDTGNSTCCGGSVGTQGGGGGPAGGQPPKKIPPPPPDTGGTGTVNEDKKETGDPTVQYRRFSGYIQVRLHCDFPDPFHFDGTVPSFSGGACLPYRPPTINGPTTAFAFPDLVQHLEEFLSKPTIAPWLSGYEVLRDHVDGPLSVCDPDEPD
jgi:hypothetical protein